MSGAKLIEFRITPERDGEERCDGSPYRPSSANRTSPKYRAELTFILDERALASFEAWVRQQYGEDMPRPSSDVPKLRGGI